MPRPVTSICSADLPPDVTLDRAIRDGEYDFVHAFYRWGAELESDFPRLKAAIRKDGMLWLSWIKKAARVRTGHHRECRARSGAGGMAWWMVKVAAIDARWSGLKLVYRLKGSLTCRSS